MSHTPASEHAGKTHVAPCELQIRVAHARQPKPQTHLSRRTLRAGLIPRQMRTAVVRQGKHGAAGYHPGRKVPVIVFVANTLGREKQVDLPDGGDLVDAADEVLAPIPFSCRSASCATCQVEVLEGAELLEPPGDAERELLELLDGPPQNRLACQARVRPGAGVIRLKPVGL